MQIINIADTPSDVDGLTWRQKNAKKTHKIEIGTLVEIASGARLFVVEHTRDCDCTPLYSLTADYEEWQDFKNNQYWQKLHGGYSEESLSIIPTVKEK